jgi:hypothetical protein
MAGRFEVDLEKLAAILHQLVHPSDQDLHNAVDELVGNDAKKEGDG